MALEAKTADELRLVVQWFTTRMTSEQIRTETNRGFVSWYVGQMLERLK